VVEFSVDAMVLFQGVFELHGPSTKPTTEPANHDGLNIGRSSKPADHHAPLEFVRKQGLPIDEKVTIENILGDFDSGKLKSYPSENPVTAGEGMRIAAPADRVEP